MKLSIFTTITDPIRRGDCVYPALDNYSELADELVIVDGSNKPEDVDSFKGKAVTVVKTEWPQEFDWTFFGEQFQRGYDACTGDWVIKADLDYIFHESDFNRIRAAMEEYKHYPALSMLKWQFLLPDRFLIKSRLINMVNKQAYGDKIRFNAGGDLCQPSVEGVTLQPNDIPNSMIPFYNYEKILKTKEQIAKDVGRMERAFMKQYGKSQYGSDGTDEDGYRKWHEAQKGKLSKPQRKIKLEQHPKVMQETIKNLKPKNFGYNGFGLIKGKVYA